MAENSRAVAERALSLVSEKLGLDRERLEKRIESVMSRRLADGSEEGRTLWQELRSEGETPTAGELLAYIIDRVGERSPTASGRELVREVSRYTLTGKRKRK